MSNLLRWLLFLGALSLLLLAPVSQLIAAGDDEDDTGGAVLDPALQWRMADDAWQKRQYDDAAVLLINFADANPDNGAALEARWRAYNIFHSYRPNPTREKIAFTTGMDDCQRWERKYATSDPNRAAAAMWYRANFTINGIGRDAAIAVLQDLVKKFPGSSQDQNAYWTMGEWLRDAGRYSEAISSYTSYRAVVGMCEQSAMAQFRIAACYQSLGNTQQEIDTYKEVFDGNYNWGWGQVHWNILSAARRLQSLGENDLAKQFAMRIIQKIDPNSDVAKQASQFLGLGGQKRIFLYPHFYHHFMGDTINIDGRTKLTLVKEVNLLIRPTYVSKDDPLNAMLNIYPKDSFATTPGPFTEDDKGKKVFTTPVTSPDKNGGVPDLWFKFTEDSTTSTSPDGLVITREWEKAGKGWGQCTIRIQSQARWAFMIYLPNNRTNPNNLSTQPNEVRDNGQTFYWYDWYDLKGGLTIKFPVEVADDVDEYYPRISLWHGTGGWFYPDKSGTDKDAISDMREMTVKLSSDTAFPYYFHTEGQTDVNLAEVKK